MIKIVLVSKLSSKTIEPYLRAFQRLTLHHSHLLLHSEETIGSISKTSVVYIRGQDGSNIALLSKIYFENRIRRQNPHFMARPGRKIVT